MVHLVGWASGPGIPDLSSPAVCSQGSSTVPPRGAGGLDARLCSGLPEPSDSGVRYIL